MTITWLGQCGFLIETEIQTIMIDPYLSDFLYETQGDSFKRLVEPNKHLLTKTPDVIVLTHDHLDHTDIPTLKQLLLPVNKSITVLASKNAFTKVKREIGGMHNYVLFNEGTEWSMSGFQFRAVKAVHSDPDAIGVICHTIQGTIYLTGDTLYNQDIVRSVGEPIDLMFTVMNGNGNNMNITDAVRLSNKIAPKTVVPVHWGLFRNDNDDPTKFAASFDNVEIAVHIPTFFKEETWHEFLINNIRF